MSEIDVSKCEHYENNGDCMDSAYHLFDFKTRFVPCKNIKNCTYKQLQQLKQENEELEQKLEKIKKLCNKYKTCNIVLKDDIFQIIESEE